MPQTDVVVIGAGPTGLALACQLLRHGVNFTIIDKKETTTPHSKAIGVQARTLEIYEQMGLAADLVSRGAMAERVRLFAGGRLRGELTLRELGKGMSPYPYLLVVEQGKHESLLHDHIRSRGVDLRWQTEMTGFTQNSEGVSVEVLNSDGAVETIGAKYLIACDGAKSPVRHALDLKFEGSTVSRMFYVADVEIDWAYGHDALQVFLMKSSLLAIFPMRGDGRHRIVGTFPEEFAKDEGDVLYEEIEQRIKQDAEIELDITHVHWFSTYRVHTRHVDKFSVGRCFLAGDSAHIHTPAGAQGMNTGIQDGYNLAWKLALVLKGRAAPSLLDTYNEERLPNARDLTRTTDRFFGFAASPEVLTSFIRLYIFPYVAGFLFSLGVIKRFVFPRVSQTAINYRDSSLSRTDTTFRVAAGDRMPWFEAEGASIYDRLREPVFHLVVFNDGRTGIPDLEAGLTGHAYDSTEMPLYPVVAEVFGASSSFFVVLRPDNYIGLISDKFSPDTITSYLSRYNG